VVHIITLLIIADRGNKS